MSESNRIACLGIVVADLVAQPVTELPARGKLAAIENMTLHSGGCAANTGIALSKLGADVAIFGATGDDYLGRFIAEELRRHRIKVSGLKRKPGCSTSATMVLVHPDGERSFLHHIGANGLFGSDDVNFRQIAACSHLHVAGALVMPKLDGSDAAELLRKARARGLSTSLDTAWDASGRWLETLAPCLPYIDYFMPSIEEARPLSGREEPDAILDFFLARGPASVILKMGELGSLARNSTQTIVAPPVPARAVDATGAGDCFAAGFIRGLLEGWDLSRCLQLGNAVGSQCVRAIGATTGVQDFQAAVKLMKETSPFTLQDAK